MSEETKVITSGEPERAESSNFIYNFITEDLAPGGQYLHLLNHQEVESRELNRI